MRNGLLWSCGYRNVVVHNEMTKTSDIFYVAETAEEVICPPDQVFKDKNLEFLLYGGGHLVYDAVEYDKFMQFLIEIGETSFTVRENFGATITPAKRIAVFEATFSVASSLDEFDKKIEECEVYSPISILHWFVHGQSKDWGIYLAEWPTIGIIGCKNELSEKFRQVFNIKGNGYEQEKELLHQELRPSKFPNNLKKFLENYKIETHHNKSYEQ